MTVYDLVLVHAPSVFDFRERQLFYGPVSDLVPSTPVFEMYPIGFTSIASILHKNGYKVRILNLAAHMLADPKFDPERTIAGIKGRVFGVDLHWLPHAHGSLEVAGLIRRHHPEAKVIMGGYSATYYSNEILEGHPAVDAVFLGDSTELPTLRYFQALDSGGPLTKVPNLAYREGDRLLSNGITHVIHDLDQIEVDYAWVVRSVLQSRDLTGHLPYLDWKRNPMFMVTLIRGCTLNCTTCMGGCRSFERNFNRPGPAFCTPEKLAAEITRIDDYLRGMIFVVGDVQLPGKHFPEKLFAAMRKDRPRNELCFEFFTPPPKELIRLMGRSLDRFDAQISPDSHDPEVRRAQGRTYSNKALEVSLGDLLEAGADRVDVFFMIGLPKQDHKSVMDTVRYSEALMNRMAAGERLLAFVSPLAPFLDPGSEAFNEPARHGYKILAHTLEEHRALLLNPSWKHVLNYETRWLSRDDIVRATYNAGEALNDAKERLGILSPEKAGVVRERVTFAREAISRIDVAMTSPEPERALAALKHDLRELSDSTVCDKRELDWDRKSWIWSMPRALIALLAGK